MKTVSVALVLCLNVGVDPPDVVKTSPCARQECWIGWCHCNLIVIDGILNKAKGGLLSKCDVGSNLKINGYNKLWQ